MPSKRKARKGRKARKPATVARKPVADCKPESKRARKPRYGEMGGLDPREHKRESAGAYKRRTVAIGSRNGTATRLELVARCKWETCTFIVNTSDADARHAWRKALASASPLVRMTSDPVGIGVPDAKGHYVSTCYRLCGPIDDKLGCNALGLLANVEDFRKRRLVLRVEESKLSKGKPITVAPSMERERMPAPPDTAGVGGVTLDQQGIGPKRGPRNLADVRLPMHTTVHDVERSMLAWRDDVAYEYYGSIWSMPGFALVLAIHASE